MINKLLHVWVSFSFFLLQSSGKFCNTRAALKACFQLSVPPKIPVEKAMCVTAFTVPLHRGLCLKPTGTVCAVWAFYCVFYCVCVCVYPTERN